MNFVRKLISTAFVAALMSTGAQANLIKNGGFEDVSGSTAIGGYGSANTWQIYTAIPEWDATQNMEIWTKNFIVPAYEGKNVLELNAHPSNRNSYFSIYQSFETTVGQDYLLTFAGRKREANATESFTVTVADLAETVINQTWGRWNEYSYTFTATTALSKLTFKSNDGGNDGVTGDTTGNILDAVRVVSVPEPGSLALLVTGLAGLVFRRRKNV